MYCRSCRTNLCTSGLAIVHIVTKSVRVSVHDEHAALGRKQDPSTVKERACHADSTMELRLKNDGKWKCYANAAVQSIVRMPELINMCRDSISAADPVMAELRALSNALGSTQVHDVAALHRLFANSFEAKKHQDSVVSNNSIIFA